MSADIERELSIELAAARSLLEKAATTWAEADWAAYVARREAALFADATRKLRALPEAPLRVCQMCRAAVEQRTAPGEFVAVHCRHEHVVGLFKRRRRTGKLKLVDVLPNAAAQQTIERWNSEYGRLAAVLVSR